jgi:hypothetical protein
MNIRSQPPRNLEAGLGAKLDVDEHHVWLELLSET